MTASPRDKTWDVAVVGGGAAGMAAAWHLRDRQVVLLEAEPRLGGRLRSEARGEVWLNLGAHLLQGPGSATHELLEALGLETVEIPGSKAALWFEGRLYPSRRPEVYPLRLPLSLGERAALVRTGVRLRTRVRGWHRATTRRGAETEFARWQRASAYEADRSFAEFLGPLPQRVDALFRSAGRRSAAELEWQTAGCGLSLFGALWVGRSSGNQLNVLGGSGRLPEAFGRARPANVMVNSTVERVESAPDGLVRLAFRQQGEHRELLTRHAIVAVPAPTASRIVPEADAEQRQSLDSVEYGSFVCMAVVAQGALPSPWPGVYAVTTPGMAFDMLFNHANPVSPSCTSLMCYAGGRSAAALLDQSEEEIARAFTRDLFRMAPALDGRITETVVHKWHIGNTYRAQSTDLTAVVRPSSGSSQIGFAGDYFGDLGGTVEAAVISGRSAAAAARESLR